MTFIFLRSNGVPAIEISLSPFLLPVSSISIVSPTLNLPLITLSILTEDAAISIMLLYLICLSADVTVAVTIAYDS